MEFMIISRAFVIVNIRPVFKENNMKLDKFFSKEFMEKLDYQFARFNFKTWQIHSIKIMHNGGIKIKIKDEEGPLGDLLYKFVHIDEDGKWASDALTEDGFYEEDVMKWHFDKKWQRWKDRDIPE